MRPFILAFTALPTMLCSGPATAQTPLGPRACVNAVFDTMQGLWGVDDAKFDPYNVPVTAWTIVRDHGHSDTFALLTSGETNVWFLTDNGADYSHDLRNGQYDGVYISERLLTCQTASPDHPAMLETMVAVGHTRGQQRLRIEAASDHLSVQRFDANNTLVSDQQMRRYAPPPSPGAPGFVAVDPPPQPPGFVVDPPPAPPRGRH